MQKRKRIYLINSVVYVVRVLGFHLATLTAGCRCVYVAYREPCSSRTECFLCGYVYCHVNSPATAELFILLKSAKLQFTVECRIYPQIKSRLYLQYYPHRPYMKQLVKMSCLDSLCFSCSHIYSYCQYPPKIKSLSRELKQTTHTRTLFPNYWDSPNLGKLNY